MAVCLWVVVISGRAEQVADTLVYPFDPVTVTAERAKTSQSTTTHATAVLEDAFISSMPVTRLSEALTLSPGLLMVQRDGLGWQPELIVRGFYGGGEADYVQVLLNGQPLNAVQNGLVNWLAAPMEDVQTIEVVRGGLGALYGDAAIGGVINLVSSEQRPILTRVRLSHGSYGESDLGIRRSGVISGRPYTAYAQGQRIDGYRDHSAGRNVLAGGSLDLFRSPQTTVQINTSNNWQHLEEPGPLVSDSLRTNRTDSEPVYRADRISEESHLLGVQLRHRFSSAYRLDTSVWLDWRSRDRVRTLPILALPLIGDRILRMVDTQQRWAITGRSHVNTQVTGIQRIGRVSTRWVVGLDVSLAYLRDRNYDVGFGSFDQYKGKKALDRGRILVDERNRRITAAGYGQLTAYLSPWLKVVVGARLDRIADQHPSLGNRVDQSASPHLGLNLRYFKSRRGRGNFYMNVSRAFKAPTMDQRYDRRVNRLPFVPPWLDNGSSLQTYLIEGHGDTTYFPPLANPELNPQSGSSVEAGLYHTSVLVPEQLDASLSLSIYQMEIRDEIDFDLESFRYSNIGRSRHTGAETGAKVLLNNLGVLFVNYTWQHVKSLTGDNSGNRLRAIPQHYLSSGISLQLTDGWSVSLMGRLFRDAYLDNANTRHIPDYSLWDGKIGFTRGSLRLTLTLKNLMNAQYVSTGFPDPSGIRDLIYYHPGAGRTARFSVERRW